MKVNFSVNSILQSKLAIPCPKFRGREKRSADFPVLGQEKYEGMTALLCILSIVNKRIITINKQLKSSIM